MAVVIAPARRYVVALARWVEPGEQVEVDDATAVSLAAQGWQTPAPPGPVRRAARRARDVESVESPPAAPAEEE